MGIMRWIGQLGNVLVCPVPNYERDSGAGEGACPQEELASSRTRVMSARIARLMNCWNGRRWNPDVYPWGRDMDIRRSDVNVGDFGS